MKVPHTPTGNVQLIHDVSWLWDLKNQWVQWKASDQIKPQSIARSEENEKWKQNWTKQMRAGALGPRKGESGAKTKILQDVSGDINICHIEDQIEH